MGGAFVAVAAIAFISMRPRPLAIETAQAARQTVREYIAEDATTRLPEEYIVDAPLSGTVERIELEIGDGVEAGQCLARMDPFNLKQQIASLEAMIAQARAYATGVDVQKPKPEDLDAAETRARQAADNEVIVRRERSIAEIDFENAKKEFDRVEALYQQGAMSRSQFDEAERVYKQAGEALARATVAEQAAAKAREIAELSSKSLSASVGDVSTCGTCTAPRWPVARRSCRR
jgi:multidrug resistance efflux pump